MIAPQEKVFVTQDGARLQSLFDLLHFLKSGSESSFNHHVNRYDNHFATWIMDVFKLPLLSSQIRGARSKSDMIEILEKYIESKTPSLAKRAPEKDKEIPVDLSQPHKTQQQSSPHASSVIPRLEDHHDHNTRDTHEYHARIAMQPLSPSQKSNDLFFKTINSHTSHVHEPKHISHTTLTQSLEQNTAGANYPELHHKNPVQNMKQAHADDLHERIAKLHREMEELRSQSVSHSANASINSSKDLHHEHSQNTHFRENASSQQSSTNQTQFLQSNKSTIGHKSFETPSTGDNTHSPKDEHHSSHPLKEKLTWLGIGLLIGLIATFVILRFGGLF
jgi:hypothetical protein